MAANNTNGSQFFVMAVDDPNLPNRYSVFGRVTEGLDTTVASFFSGDSASVSDGVPPKVPAVIKTVTVTES